MPKIKYRDQRFNAATKKVLLAARDIIEDYARRGYSMTLRQVYYQLVKANVIQNDDKVYKQLGELISNGRYAGIIDWPYIRDRGRPSYGTVGWDSPGDYMASTAGGYNLNKWAEQPCHVEVWVEKEALIDVIARPAREVECNYFACKGYVSSTVIFDTAMRLMSKQRDGKEVVIIHLGDHDPSGTHMSKDILDRIVEMMGAHGYKSPEVNRIALTMDQIEAQGMPPQPAKTWDSRFNWYYDQYGTRDSWELDAATPEFLYSIIVEAVKSYRVESLWDSAVKQQEEDRKVFHALQDNWEDVSEWIHEQGMVDYSDTDYDPEKDEDYFPEEPDDE